MSDFLGMSDEDFMKQETPEGAPLPEPTKTDEQTLADTLPGAESEGGAETVEAPASDAPDAPVAAEPDADTVPGADSLPGGAADPVGSKPAAVAAAPDLQAAAAADAAKVAAEAPAPASTEPPNYQAFYEQIMTPFKANGRTVELKNPQEAIQLMQMGANYTRKMQELAPHRKLVMMLTNAGLDESRLSFLIDIDKKKPEAIKQLIKDSGVDPLDIDTSTDSNYQAGAHTVTDVEVVFQSTLDEMKSTEAGVRTLQVINGGWDSVSKEVLWGSPEIIGIIHEQRESGVYDRITAEMDRQKTLGKLRPETPFLQAYKTVGDEMVAANKFADLAPPAPKPNPGTAPVSPPVAAPPVVVATRVGSPKPAATNGDKAQAASSTRAAPTNAKGQFINPLAMSDDDFLKQMDGRL